MRKHERTIVAFIFTTLVHSTCVHCLSKNEFAVKLRQAAESTLGIAEFQVCLTTGI